MDPLTAADAAYRLIEDRQGQDEVAWHGRLGAALFEAALVPVEAVASLGPDGLAYIRLRRPPQPGDGLAFEPILEEAISQGAGLVFLDDRKIPAFVLSAGDVLSLAIYGTARYIWPGAWGEEPEPERYRNRQASFAAPNPALIPPPVALLMSRALEPEYRRYPALRGREPGLTLMIPADESPADDPVADFVLNAFSVDFASHAEYESFQQRVTRFLPFTQARRLVWLTQPIPNEVFVPFRILAEAEEAAEDSSSS